jgi:hypothetical protein
MGEIQNQSFQLSFNATLKIDFQGSRVTPDGGLILVRKLDERLGCRKPSDAAVSEKLMEQVTIAGVQDSGKAEESRSDHLGE